MCDYLMKIVRHIVHDYIEICLVSFLVLCEEIVIDLNAAGMLQKLHNFELSICILGILEDLFNCKFSIGWFFYDFEDLAKSAFSNRLKPDKVVTLVWLFSCLLDLGSCLKKCLCVVLSCFCAHLVWYLNSRPFHDLKL